MIQGRSEIPVFEISRFVCTQFFLFIKYEYHPNAKNYKNFHLLCDFLCTFIRISICFATFCVLSQKNVFFIMRASDVPSRPLDRFPLTVDLNQRTRTLI